MPVILAWPDPTPNTVTVRELVTWHLAEQELRCRARRIVGASLERLRRVLGSFSKRFGHRLAASIRPADVNRWLVENGRWVADVTRQQNGSAVRTVFRWAEHFDLIHIDPLHRLPRRRPIAPA